MGKKLKGAQILVGNRLTDGRAVFFNSDTGWHADAGLATAAEGDALDGLIAAARITVESNEIAGFEPVEAATDTGVPAPIHGKPLMQTKGPSVRQDLGYQTGLNWENA